MMPNDLRIELRCRNNVLWHAIFDVYPSIRAFCDAHDLDYARVVDYLNLKTSPYLPGSSRDTDPLFNPHPDPASYPDLRASAQKVCDAIGLGKDELFPARLYDGVIPARRVAEISAAQLAKPITGGTQVLLPADVETTLRDDDRRRIVTAMLSELTPRQRFVIQQRFGLLDDSPQTLEAIALALGLGRARVAQIEAAALTKLRRKHKRLAAIDYTDDGGDRV